MALSFAAMTIDGSGYRECFSLHICNSCAVLVSNICDKSGDCQSQDLTIVTRLKAS